MKLRIALFACLCACAGPESPSETAAASSGTPPAQSTPLPSNMEDVLRHFQVSSGYNITYDSGTASVLAGLEVTRVGPEELRVLKVGPAAGRASAAKAEAPVSEVVVLQYAAAPELAETLNDLVDSASAGAGGSDEVRIGADARTNSLLIQAPAARMSEIEALVERLDVRVE